MYRGSSHEFIDAKQEFIEVYTGNDSGRLTLEVGREYLLFAHTDDDGELAIWCGGNSAELKDARRTIRQIEQLLARMQSAHGGDIWGEVRSFDAGPIEGVPGLLIVVEGGNGHTYVARTNRKGQFHVHVPEGQYSARVESAKWDITWDVYAYEGPLRLGFKVERGGCRDLLFDASPKRPSPGS